MTDYLFIGYLPLIVVIVLKAFPVSHPSDELGGRGGVNMEDISSITPLTLERFQNSVWTLVITGRQRSYGSLSPGVLIRKWGGSKT